MGYNYVTSRGAKALEDAGTGCAAVLIILLVIALVAGFAALGFWLFIWAVGTLFHVTIAWTWANFWAYFVLSWIFGRGSSSSSDKK
jgi:hypothetical protein